MLINYTMWSSNLFLCIQLLPEFFIVQSPDFSESRFFRAQVFVSPGFSGSRFFWVQIFQGPGFLESRFFWVRVQGLGPGFRSSRFANVLNQFLILHPWKVPWNWIAFYWNSFVISLGLMRGETGRLANEVYFSNSIVLF